MPVAVIVDESATCAPRFARSSYAGFLSHFGEDSVIVVVETILSVIGDVEIFPSVVVVVADADTLPPSGSGKTCLHGYIGESSVVVVAIETIRRTLPGRIALEPRAID